MIQVLLASLAYLDPRRFVCVDRYFRIVAHNSCLSWPNRHHSNPCLHSLARHRLYIVWLLSFRKDDYLLVYLSGHSMVKGSRGNSSRENSSVRIGSGTFSTGILRVAKILRRMISTIFARTWELIIYGSGDTFEPFQKSNTRQILFIVY